MLVREASASKKKSLIIITQTPTAEIPEEWKHFDYRFFSDEEVCRMLTHIDNTQKIIMSWLSNT